MPNSSCQTVNIKSEPTISYVWKQDDIFLFFKDFHLLFIFRERGREEERKRNIHVWLTLTCPLLGIWPKTQACA